MALGDLYSKRLGAMEYGSLYPDPQERYNFNNKQWESPEDARRRSIDTAALTQQRDPLKEIYELINQQGEAKKRAVSRAPKVNSPLPRPGAAGIALLADAFLNKGRGDVFSGFLGGHAKGADFRNQQAAQEAERQSGIDLIDAEMYGQKAKAAQSHAEQELERLKITQADADKKAQRKAMGLRALSTVQNMADLDATMLGLAEQGIEVDPIAVADIRNTLQKKDDAEKMETKAKQAWSTLNNQYALPASRKAAAGFLLRNNDGSYDPEQLKQVMKDADKESAGQAAQRAREKASLSRARQISEKLPKELEDYSKKWAHWTKMERVAQQNANTARMNAGTAARNANTSRMNAGTSAARLQWDKEKPAAVKEVSKDVSKLEENVRGLQEGFASAMIEAENARLERDQLPEEKRYYADEKVVRMDKEVEKFRSDLAVAKGKLKEAEAFKERLEQQTVVVGEKTKSGQTKSGRRFKVIG